MAGVGTPQPFGYCSVGRAWLAGTAGTLAPLLWLEDLDLLARSASVPLTYWPGWVSLPIAAAVGLAVAAWTGIDRRPETVTRVELAAGRVVRFTLFAILSVYSTTKILGVQFRLPYAALDTPLGDATGYMLAWRFFGYSHGHELFVAAVEGLGPALLLFRRTATLGACLTTAVLTNVVVVNFTHDLPVQRFSCCLLAVTAYLLLSDGRRLVDFFVLDRPVEPRPIPGPAFHSSLVSGVLKVVWIVGSIAYSCAYIRAGDSRPTPVMGAWSVESADPPVPWRTVYFERGTGTSFPGSIRRDAGAKPERFRYEFDAAGSTLRFAFPGGGPTFDGRFILESDSRLRLTGRIDGRPVEVGLVRKR